MTDLERAARAVAARLAPALGWEPAMAEKSGLCRDVATAVIESVLLEPSEDAVEAAWDAFNAAFTHDSGRASMRAALKAAALAILGREGSAG